MLARSCRLSRTHLRGAFEQSVVHCAHAEKDRARGARELRASVRAAQGCRGLSSRIDPIERDLSGGMSDVGIPRRPSAKFGPPPKFFDNSLEDMDYDTDQQQLTGSRTRRESRSGQRPPKRKLPKKPRSVDNLFNVLIEDEPKVHLVNQPAVLGTDEDPDAADIEQEYEQRLAQLRNEFDLTSAKQLLNDIIASGYTPSMWTYAAVARSHALHDDPDTAEKMLHRLLEATSESEAPSARIVRSVKSSISVAFARQRRSQDVLRVMGWCGVRAQTDLDGLLRDMALGREDLLWGLLMSALNFTGDHEMSLRVLDSSHGIVPMSDSMCHLGVEALGALRRFREVDTLFSTFLRQGNVPNERLAGTVLRYLSAPVNLRRGQQVCDPSRIAEVVSMIKEPSPRFIATSLHAFVNAGMVPEAVTCFRRLEEHTKPGLPNERACMALMRVYANRIVMEVPEHVQEDVVSTWYKQLNEGADRLWEQYYEAYGNIEPAMEEQRARMMIFPKYLLVKALSGELDRAVELIEEAGKPASIAARPWFRPTITHLNALLSGVEKAFASRTLERALEIMNEQGIAMDDACLASSIGSLVGDGLPFKAAKLLVVQAGTLLNADDNSFLFNNRIRLLRRLELLDDALNHSSVAPAEEHAVLMEQVCVARGQFSADALKRVEALCDSPESTPAELNAAKATRARILKYIKA